MTYVAFSLLETEVFQARSKTWLEHASLEAASQREEAFLGRRPQPAPHALIGRLEIPDLRVSTAVLEGTDARTLKVAAGHLRGSAWPREIGNVVIAAHRDSFFRPLQNITKQERITLTTPEGSYDYYVVSTEVVGPGEVRVLAPSRRRELTLVTCYPFYYVGPAPKRFIVHARALAS